MELDSHLARGTTVSLYLPRAKDRQSDPLAQAEWPEPCTNKVTVLVVEPEADHQMKICECLTLSGYRAIAATNASGALACLASDEQVHILLTEVLLPGDVSGAALVRDARCMRPDIRALLTSSSTVKATANGDIEGMEFLKKPYQVSDLVRLVGALSKDDTFCIETEQLLADARDFVPPRNVLHSVGSSWRRTRQLAAIHSMGRGAAQSAWESSLSRQLGQQMSMVCHWVSRKNSPAPSPAFAGLRAWHRRLLPLLPTSRWGQCRDGSSLIWTFWLKALFARKAMRFGCWRDC